MAIDRQFVKNLVQDVQAQMPEGTTSPADPRNPAYAQLLADQAAVRAKISASDGKQVVSVNAGEGASWQTSGSLQDLWGAYTEAIATLNGRMPIIRQTTARFLP